MPVPATPNSNAAKPLSSQQERRLVAYMDAKFLDIYREHKKRSHSSSTLKTLPEYLNAMRTMVSLILQIPPVPPSMSLRTTFLLRLTNDALLAIPGYQPEPGQLHELLCWFDDLDQAWTVVLRAQAWMPPPPPRVESNEDDDGQVDDEDDDDMLLDEPNVDIDPRALTLTDRTRLRSLLVMGEGRLEDWLGHMDIPQGSDLVSVLESLGLQRGFDQLFARALRLIGGLEGIKIIQGNEVGLSCAVPT